MSTATTPLLDELAVRKQQVAKARGRVREIEAEANVAQADARRIKELLTEAFASDDQAQAEKLTRAKTKADAKAAEPWPERRAGAERAAGRVQSERDGWIAQNAAGLIRELSPLAEAARDLIVSKVTELEEARQEWHAVSQRVSGVLSVAPGNDRTPGIDHIDTAIKDVRRATVDVPAPLPVQPQTITIPPEFDPDPEIREPAQEAMRAAYLDKKAA